MPILQFYYLMTYGTEQVQYVQNQTYRRMKRNWFSLFHIGAHDPNISGPLRAEIATTLIPLNIITRTDQVGNKGGTEGDTDKLEVKAMSCTHKA